MLLNWNAHCSIQALDRHLFFYKGFGHTLAILLLVLFITEFTIFKSIFDFQFVIESECVDL